MNECIVAQFFLTHSVFLDPKLTNSCLAMLAGLILEPDACALLNVIFSH